MTRKDYVAIAAAIKPLTHHSHTDRAIVEVVAINIAKALERDNPRFDYNRFLVACGVV